MNERNSMDFVVMHPLDAGDAAIAGAMRDMTRASKGVSVGIEARGQFDAFMERVTPRDDVTFETDTIGGITGLWVRPAVWNPEEAIIHLHGGWFAFGSATAYRHLVGQVVARAGARAFVPDYRLAPEHSFPAAVDDVFACYQALARREIQRIALTGDSAGGNLALGLTSRVVDKAAPGDKIPVAVAVMSPVTDLTLSGQSYDTRAIADPLFTHAQIAKLVRSYLATAVATHPLASPLHGQYAGMPPTRIHVGDHEVLLDDSLRFVERAVSAGVDARVDVWLGMPHGFQGSVGRLKAAALSLDSIGSFLAERLNVRSGP